MRTTEKTGCPSKLPADGELFHCKNLFHRLTGGCPISSDYAPGYICLKEHYAQSGYEDSPGASHVAPEVEDVLMAAIRGVLKVRQ